MTQGYIAFLNKVAVYVDGVKYSYSYITTHSGPIIDYGGGTYGQEYSFSASSPVANATFDHWDCGGAESVFTDIDINSLANAFSTQWQSGSVQTFDVYLTAYFTTSSPPQTDSAIDLQLVGVPQNVGSLIGGGIQTGAVGTSATYTVIAELLAAMKGRYRFSHWIDNQNVRHDEKSFSKTFTFKTGYTPQNPEVIIFTAYFVECTGLILRSASSGIILRGKANRILRDK